MGKFDDEEDSNFKGKKAHPDRERNARDWEWFLDFYEFATVYVPAIPECGFHERCPLPASNYWYKVSNDLKGKPYGVILAEPCLEENLWPRNTEQTFIEYDQTNRDFKSAIDIWFNNMIKCKKIRRKDKREFKKVKVNSYENYKPYKD